MAIVRLQNIVVPRSARYAVLGTSSGSTRSIWFVLHGYGQLASFFIQKFAPLADEQTLVIAPEGLHRFYLEGSSGRVGASWMTKEDRLNDIQDYIHYLDTVYESIVNFPQPVKITVLGFSQGGATASRWVSQSRFAFDNLILWSAVFPPDLDLRLTQSKVLDTGLYLVCGDKDPYINPQELKVQEDQLNYNGFKPKLITFNGKHELDPGVILHFKEIL